MMKKMLAGPAVAGVLLLGTATAVGAQNPETTPVDDATATTDDDDDDGSSKVGLLGLLGLAGLAGLAGLRRHDHDNRTQYQQTRPQV